MGEEAPLRQGEEERPQEEEKVEQEQQPAPKPMVNMETGPTVTIEGTEEVIDP